MLLIEHRVNTVEKLRSVPVEYGVEIDIRDYDGDLRCVHDPLRSGERLADLLSAYRHALAIFNVKCDGLDKRITDLAKQHGISQYFFWTCQSNAGAVGTQRRATHRRRRCAIPNSNRWNLPWSSRGSSTGYGSIVLPVSFAGSRKVRGTQETLQYLPGFSRTAGQSTEYDSQLP